MYNNTSSDVFSGPPGAIDVRNPPAGRAPAAGDGVTDDAPAIQAIINAIIDARPVPAGGS